MLCLFCAPCRRLAAHSSAAAALARRVDASWGGADLPERAGIIQSIVCMAYIGVRVLKALRALHEHGAAAQLTDEEAGGVLAWPLAAPPCMARLLSGIMAGNYDCQAADFFAVLCSDVAELHTLGGGYEAALRSVQALVAPLLHGLMEAAERLALPGRK